MTQARLRHQISRQRRTLPGVGSYWARPVSNFNINIPSSLSSHYVASFLKSRECQKHSTSIGSIALSIAYDPSILVIRDIQGIGKTMLPHASRYQTSPMNLNA